MAEVPNIPKSEIKQFLHLLIELDWDKWNSWFYFWGFSRFLVHTILFIGLLSILSLQIPNLFLFATGWLVGTAPIWLPIAMIIGFYQIWFWYARSNFIFHKKPVLLEMKIPREITKSPRAMETALSTLWVPQGVTTLYQRMFMGMVLPWYSFELASFGGEIHFYIWVWKDWQKIVEASLYGQYPEIELHEVEDYAQKFRYDPDTQTCYAMGWRLEPLSNDRYIDAYVMKTYVDLELDKDPKEEVKVDPFSSVLEVLASITPEQQMWIQILITPEFKHGKLNPRFSDWEVRVRNEVEAIRAQAAMFGKTIHLTEEQMRVARPRPTWMQEHQLETMQRNLGKHPFKVVARAIYISPHKDYGVRFWDLRWIWRPFANPQYMTQLRNRWYHTVMDYPWQDIYDIRWEMLTKRFIDAYRRRSGFYSPWEFPSNIMTTELLATLYHPPSSSIKAPGLVRIESKKSSPPPNLPQ
ncbi:MAG: hypothetical protein AAB899_01640 [Patescibacteria group bacterium]